MLPLVHYVKVDIQEVGLTLMEARLEKLRLSKLKLIAEKVQTYAEFNHCRELGFDYFQGFYLARPEIVKHKQMGTSKLSLLELVAVSSGSNFDYEKVNQVLQRDVGLSFMLLRFIK